MLKEFRDFALRGNVVDLVVGFTVGAAFGGVVKSLVDDVIMPPIGLLLGKVNFSSLFIALNGKIYLVPRRGEGRRSTDSELWFIRKHTGQFFDRGFRGLYPGQTNQQTHAEKGRGACRADDKGLSILLHGHSGPGHPLPELHIRPEIPRVLIVAG